MFESITILSTYLEEISNEVMNILVLVIKHTVVIIKHSIFNIKPRLLLKLSTVYITRDLIVIGISNICIRRIQKFRARQQSITSQIIVGTRIFNQASLVLENNWLKFVTGRIFKIFSVYLTLGSSFTRYVIIKCLKWSTVRDRFKMITGVIFFSSMFLSWITFFKRFRLLPSQLGSRIWLVFKLLLPV